MVMLERDPRFRCFSSRECADAGIDCGKECWRHPCHGMDCEVCEYADACEQSETKKEVNVWKPS